MDPLVGHVMDHGGPWVLHEGTLLDAFHQDHVASLQSVVVQEGLKIDEEARMEVLQDQDLDPYDHRDPLDLQAPSYQEEDHSDRKEEMASPMKIQMILVALKILVD